MHADKIVCLSQPWERALRQISSKKRPEKEICKKKKPSELLPEQEEF